MIEKINKVHYVTLVSNQNHYLFKIDLIKTFAFLIISVNPTVVQFSPKKQNFLIGIILTQNHIWTERINWYLIVSQ